MKKLQSILAVVAITGSLTLSGCIHVEREAEDTTTTTRTTTLRSPVAPSTTVERTTVVND